MSSSMMHKVPLIVMGIFLLHFFYFTTPRVFAADAIDIEASPRLQHFIVKPGASASANLKIVNHGDPVYLSFSLEHDPSVTISTASAPQQVALGEVVLFEKNMQIDFKLTIKQDSKQSSENDTSIRFITSSKNVFASHGTGIHIDLEPQIYSQIVLSRTIDGSLDMRPRISIFQNPQGRVVMGNTDQAVDLVVQNTGNHMTYVSGTIKVVDPSGQNETISVPRTAIFAQSVQKIAGNRSLSMLWFPQNRLKIGQYQVSTELNIPGPEHVKLYAQTTFIVLSERLLVLSVALVLALFGCILYIYFTYLHTRAWKPISILKSSLN
ncbi:MAG: hypothetical protein WCO78_02520 [Candidatus Roizmanbacteria bacterium]